MRSPSFFRISPLVLFLVFALTDVAAQSTQTVRGRVVDSESDFPLAGVTIQWWEEGANGGGVSDGDGYFVLTDVPVGRHDFRGSYLGYEPLTVAGVLVSAGKETQLTLRMRESVASLSMVTVTDASATDNVNDMTLVGATTLRVEEVIRYSGTFGDVARMAQNFAGVSGATDDRNDIIVRGNSPATVLWRIEGVDVPSPNHWATLGSTGGPVSLLNTNNLRTSDFLSGAFPAEYDNATGAVFDLKLRNGNSNKREFLGQIGFNGFEAGAEGPLRKIGRQSSYLINFRYSTLEVLSAIGLDFGTGFAIPRYQDVNFKVNVPTERAGRFSVWGIGGNSDIQFLAEESGENLFSPGEENLRSGTTTGMLGANHLYFFNDRASSSFSLFASRADNRTRREEILEDVDAANFVATFLSRNVQDKYVAKWDFNYKLNARHRLKTGVAFEHYELGVVDSVLLDGERWFRELDFAGSAGLGRAYAQWKYKATEKLTFNAGLSALWFTLNGSRALGPRLSASWQSDGGATLAFGYGRHAQLQPLPVYFSKNDGASAEENQRNEQLDFQRSDHFVLSYARGVGRKLHLKSSLYYQALASIATDPDDPDFSLINFGADFGFPNRAGLDNSGTGRNYGLELTLNRRLDEGFYGLLTASVFNSTFGPERRNTYYNTNFAVNLLAGKEFSLSDKLTLTLDGRFTVSGGRRYTPIDLEASREAGRTVLEPDRAFTERLASYLRPDLKVGIRRDGRKTTHTYSVDFQNFIGRENELEKFFSVAKDGIRTRRQRGFFPDVRYQVLF